MVMAHGWDNYSLCFSCARFKNFYKNRAILFFVWQLEFMQIWTECPALKKVEIILFFGSDKLKKCTNNFYPHDFPNYANFEG